MSEQNNNNGRRQGLCRGANSIGSLVFFGTCFAIVGALSLTQATPSRAGVSWGDQDKDGAGVTISKQATPKDVGLPAYPGAKLHKDEKDDSPSVQLGLWGSTFGFKLAVMKMESGDAPGKIADFYKKALTKYGTVLDCSETSQKANSKEKNGTSNQLTCEDDKPEKGGLLFKAGTKEKQHLVSVKPNGTGCIFNLLYIEARSDDKTPA